METNGLSPEDSLAKTSVSPETEQDSTERGLVFGLSIGVLLGTYDQDSQSWKTSALSLFEDSTECLDRLPRSGMMRSGKIFEQATWVRRTGENESGLWRTPDTGAGGTSGLLKDGIDYRENGEPIQVRLCDQVANQRLWPGKRHLYPTPCANPEAPNHGSNSSGPHNLLEVAKEKWSPGMTWPTPHAQCHAGIGEHGQGGQNLQTVVGGQLNPQFVEWLMGYPIGWSDSKDSEIQLSLKSQK